MKKIIDWLKELEEPYRSQAIKNTIDLNSNGEQILNDFEESLEDSLYNAFIWSESTQGLDYWIELKNSICAD